MWQSHEHYSTKIVTAFNVLYCLFSVNMRNFGNADTRNQTIKLSLSSPPGISERSYGQLGGMVVSTRSSGLTSGTPFGFWKRTLRSVSQAKLVLLQQVMFSPVSRFMNIPNESRRRDKHNNNLHSPHT